MKETLDSKHRHTHTQLLCSTENSIVYSMNINGDLITILTHVYFVYGMSIQLNS